MTYFRLDDSDALDRGAILRADCTVVIPVWAYDRRIHQVWTSAREAFEASGARLFVVDNGSKVPLAHSDHRFDENQGYPTAVNYGLERADTEWIAVGSHDIIVPPGWLRPLLTRGVASPIESGPYLTESRRRYRGSFFGPLFVMHRTVYETVGGIDPTFPIMGDRDWAIRAFNAGFPFTLAETVQVEHRERSRGTVEATPKPERKAEEARFKAKWQGVRGFGAWERLSLSPGDPTSTGNRTGG